MEIVAIGCGRCAKAGLETTLFNARALNRQKVGLQRVETCITFITVI